MMVQDITSLERAGQWGSAAEAYGERFRRAAADEQLATLVSAVHDAARMRQQQGRLEEAEELALLSREIAERCDLPREAARATNTLAVLRHGQQDWEGARELYEVASEMATDLGDDTLLAWTHQNLGVVANIVGNLERARTLYLESVGYTVRSGDRQTAMMAYNNLGIVCADLRDWTEAEVYFDRGIEIAEQFGDRPMLATLFLNRAEPLIEMGELDRAWASLDQAESLASWIEDPVTTADIERFRGRIARLQRNFHAAGQHLERAISTATHARLRLEGAEALEELAHLRWATGYTDEARDLIRRAGRVFRGLGAGRDADRAEMLLTRWSGAPEAAATP